MVSARVLDLGGIVNHRLRAGLLRPFALGVLFLAPACGGGGGGGGGGPAFDAQIAAQAIETYADILYENYSDVLELTQELKTAVDDFVAAPSAEGLDAARDAWRAVRPFYIQTEMGRFYDGPIDRAPAGLEVFINAWPLDEAHIDYVSGNANAGIVNDAVTYPTIDAPTVRGANEQGGEANISTGWHAIEFLLFGQDVATDGPGARPYTDYVSGMGGTAANQDRRRAYLGIVTDMLIGDLQVVRDEWTPGSGAYRNELLALPVSEALSRILTGIGTLAFGELRGERLIVPYTTKLQEDEHSCFSDTTHLDHRNDLEGIRNVWFGAYASSDGGHDVLGVGLDAVAGSADPTRAAEITDLLDDLASTLSSPLIQPFDQAILGDDATPGRMQIQQALDELSDFNDAFSALAAEMGIDITTQL
jgi:putative iron-regulated protein